LHPCTSLAVTYIDHFVSQFAGEIGLVSAGLGKDFSRYSISGLYGIVPSEYSGGADGPLIETFAVRQTYRFYEWERMDFHVGLNVFHVLSLRYESAKFKNSPPGYYPIGSVRGLLNLGTSINLNKINTRSFYVEGGLNDIWIVNWLNNYNTINPSDHISIAAGYKFKF
jgi:hypothetical protein